MINIPKKWIVIIIGPPGAGKGTQAEMLADDFALFNFETSKVIEEKIKTGDANDPTIKQEKDNFESGKLVTPEVVVGWISEKIRGLASGGVGIVFSGSPRTVYEGEKEMPIFDELYGRENVKVFNLDIGESESVERNSHRHICKANRHPIPNLPEFKDMKICPKDGSELELRSIDNPETIKIRYQTYLEETKPVVDLLDNMGYKVIRVGGNQTIKSVHDEIMGHLTGELGDINEHKVALTCAHP